MTVRRVVTGDVDGRSRVIVDGPAHAVDAIDEIWVSSPSQPLGVDPAELDITLEPPAGGVRFRVASIPPNSPRFHVTNTVRRQPYDTESQRVRLYIEAVRPTVAGHGNR